MKDINLEELSYLTRFGYQESGALPLREKELRKGVQKTLDRLVEKGLVKLGREFPSGTKIYVLTQKGNDCLKCLLSIYKYKSEIE